MTLALILFGVAALGGVLLAVKVFSGSQPPWPLSILHAALGAAGIISLLLAISSTAFGGAAWVAFILFVVAALGGFFLASFHARGQSHPKPVVVIHAGVAVLAFLLLAGIVAGIV
jgi:hypothetical protein